MRSAQLGDLLRLRNLPDQLYLNSIAHGSPSQKTPHPNGSFCEGPSTGGCTQSAMPVLRSFEFEKLPPTVRHKIYRELLLKPGEFDSQSEDRYLSEHDELGHRIQDLLVEIWEEDNQMHPEIMRTNKSIHDEAAAVLYGENWFSWSLSGHQYQPMWRFPWVETSLCPRRYTRLITKIHLIVSTRGDENDPYQSDAVFWTTRNLRSTCKTFTLNDFKILKVDFYNALGYRYCGSARKGYYGERCLEPLKVCRAEKVSIGYVEDRGPSLKLTSIAVSY